MKTHSRYLLILPVWLALAGSAGGQIPNIITYQGRVTVDGTNYTGPGRFKFAIRDGSTGVSHWSNDGTSVNGSEPALHVGTPVSEGQFTIPLGDTLIPNMTAIPYSVFTHPDVRLRIWFTAGEPNFTQLTPDQRLTSVGYAMQAACVPDGAITTDKLATGAVTSDKIADNSITSADVANALTLQTLNLGGINWDGVLNLFAKPTGGGGIVNPSGEPRGHLEGDEFGSEFRLYFSNGETGAVLSSRSPGGRLRLWDGLASPTVFLGTTVGGGDLTLFQINGKAGIRLDGDRATYDNQVSAGGEISIFNQGGLQAGVFLDGEDNDGGLIALRNQLGLDRLLLRAVSTGNGGEIAAYDASSTKTVEILAAESGTTGAQLKLRQADNTATAVIDAEFNPNGGARAELFTGAGISTIAMQASGGDASLSGGGLFRLGPLDGANLVFDGNEITARNNAAEAPLFLNPNQGNVVIGGTGELTPRTRLLVESDTAQDAFRVRVDGMTRLYVSSAGKVGINTTNLATGYELSVNGQIICQELVVQNASEWPDYVFDQDYELMPLDKLESSIRRHKRLPGIPSAQEVKSGGVSVGEMQNRMMEKIEELTLYILQQNKRLEAQEAQLQALRTQLSPGK